MTAFQITEGTAGRAVGLLVPACLAAGGGAGRFSQMFCAVDSYPRAARWGDDQTPVAPEPVCVSSADRRPTRSGSSLAFRHFSPSHRQYRHRTQRGTRVAGVFSFSSIAAHQPASYSRRDASQGLPALHRNNDGATHVRAVGKFFQSNGDQGEHG